MEIHKGWVSSDLIKQAREDVLKNTNKTYKQQNRINLAEFESEAIKQIADECQALAWHTWRPERSGAQIHESGSYGKSDQSWHQDIAALGGAHGSIAWVPLDPIDGTRPSLMFAGEVKALPHVNDSRDFSVAVDNGSPDVGTIILAMSLGDVAVFNWSELHRTYWTSNMFNGRISLDLRYVP